MPDQMICHVTPKKSVHGIMQTTVRCNLNFFLRPTLLHPHTLLPDFYGTLGESSTDTDTTPDSFPRSGVFEGVPGPALLI